MGFFYSRGMDMKKVHIVLFAVLLLVLIGCGGGSDAPAVAPAPVPDDTINLPKTGQTTSYADAAEPVPFDDFVKIAEQTLDALDEIETVLSSSNSTQDLARVAFNKFDIAQKKYHRYVTSPRFPEGVQRDIAAAMFLSRMQYETAFLNGIYSKEPDNVNQSTFDKAKQSTQEARDKFMKYKNNHNNRK